PVSEVVFSPNGTAFSARVAGRVIRDLVLPLPGRFQLENCRTALAVIAELAHRNAIDWDTDAIRSGIGQVRWPGRLTIRPFSTMKLGRILRVDGSDAQHDESVLVIDGAHNPRAVRAVLNSLVELYPDHVLDIITAVPANKDAQAMLQVMREYTDRVIVTAYHSSRSLLPEVLAGIAERCGLVVTPTECLEAAMSAAVSGSGRRRVVLVIGSLYLAGEALALIGEDAACLTIY
ncbi:hypothetical protein JXA80_13655, partial [bacterium]|nr:hypothetical protein [candidate division CSSED10-310 bacterium]